MTLHDILNTIKEKIKMDYLTIVVPKINKIMNKFNEILTGKLLKIKDIVYDIEEIKDKYNYFKFK